MRHAYLVVLLLGAGTVAAAAETVDWRDAASCVNRVCTIRATVAAEEDRDGALRLYFDRERRDVSALLVRSLFVSWPRYSGRDIVATGKVRKFRDTIEIVVQHPSAIEVVGGETPSTVEEPEPTPPPASEIHGAPPQADETPEVERLRRQVERLEQRVRELEGEGR